MNKSFVIGVYCPPNTAKNNKPTQINDEQYFYIKELGVNYVYGHNEAFNSEYETESVRALELCEKYEINYLVKDNIYKRFTTLKSDDFKIFNELTEDERIQLGNEYKKSLNKYKDYKSFAGVEFIDEPGHQMLEGIKYAKSIFDEVCKDKLFYVNMLPYWTLKEQLQYGLEYGKFTEKNENLFSEPKQCRYQYYLSEFLDKLKLQILSYDAYPILTLGNEKNMIHIALYDHLKIAQTLSKNRNIDFWNFIQAGGKWENCSIIRVPTESEIALQINLSIAYGARGIQIFPYAYPNDWDDDEQAIAGLIDKNGKKTALYGYFKNCIDFIKKIENYLMQSSFLYETAVGEFKSDLSDYETLLKIKDNDCIFDGRLSFKEIKEVKYILTNSQLVIGVYKYNSKTLLYVVNNSILYESEFEINLYDEMNALIINENSTKEIKSSCIKSQLQPGYAQLILLN